MAPPVPPSSSRLAHRAAAAALDFVAGRPSLGQLRAIGHTLAGLAPGITRDAAHVASTNIALCFPERTEAERQQWLEASLRASAELVAECAGIWSRPSARVLPWVLHVDGLGPFDVAYREGRGVICLVPHFGNWEVLNTYLGSHYPFAALYEPLRSAFLAHWITRGRERAGSRMHPPSLAGMRALRGHLNAGGVIGILPDQVPNAGAGVVAPFFGRPALTGTLAVRMAAHARAPVFLAAAVPVHEPHGFRLVFEELAIPWSTLEAAHAAARANDAIEALVRTAPPLYQWEYKRFKHATPGIDPYRTRVT